MDDPRGTKPDPAANPRIDVEALRAAMGSRARVTWGMGRSSFAARFGVIMGVALFAVLALLALVILIPVVVIALIGATGLGLYNKISRALGGRKGVEGRENVRVIERR